MSFISNIFKTYLTAKELPGIKLKEISGKGKHTFVAPTNVRSIKFSFYSSDNNLFYQFIQPVFGGENFIFEIDQYYSRFYYSNTFPITIKNDAEYSAKLIIEYQAF